MKTSVLPQGAPFDPNEGGTIQKSLSAAVKQLQLLPTMLPTITSDGVLLSRKGDFSELLRPSFDVVLEVFVCECAKTSTLKLGEEERDNVRGKENV